MFLGYLRAFFKVIMESFDAIFKKIRFRNICWFYVANSLFEANFLEGSPVVVLALIW